MPSAMDQSLAKLLEAFLAPGAPLELTTITRFGTELPMFKHAPPSLAHYFAHYCTQHADRPFLIDGGIRLTYGETMDAARTLTGALIAGCDVQPGDRVGIAARNSANWIVAYMAVLMAGGCATLLNGWWTAEEMNDAIALAGCRIILADPQRAARLEGEAHGAQVLVFSHGTPEEGFAAILERNGGRAVELPELGPDDIATILFTSGSTGRAKGVLADHRGKLQAVYNFTVTALSVLGHMTKQGEQPVDPPCALLPIPLFHITGEIVLLLMSFALGRKVVLMPKWDPVEAMRLIEAEKVTYFVGVPLMSHEILNHPQRGEFDLSSCRTFGSGGAARPVGHVREVPEKSSHGLPGIGYGLTETNAVGCSNFNENYLAKPGSTGPGNPPLVDLAIFGADGEKLEQGQTGEVAIRSICNFLGYWENPEATREAIRPDGYFLTGDLGYLDEDGYLFIVDRKKDIIIRGGENISCVEVEQAIYSHPDIAECSVFGLPDERYGEIVGAVWVPQQGRDLAEDDLHEYLVERLAAFKIPAMLWREAGPLPRLGTEKVDKRSLREKYSALSGPQ